MAKQGSLSINSENIFPIIKKWLYSDHDIFIRELVSNGCDAVTKLKKLSVMGEFEEADDEKYKVEVRINPTDKTLTFIDNGIGMTEDEVDEYINQIAFSGAAAFMEQYKDKASDEQIIGHFGLGFYSAFMVADKVTIDTLSYKEGATPVHWECDGGTEFDMEDGDKAERGTTITLYLNDESYEFCNEYRCREVLNKYCSFMPVEIYFVNEEEEAKKAEEAAKKDAEEKVIDVDVKDADAKENNADTEDGDSEVTLEEEEEEEDDAPKPINQIHPLWTKHPNDCTDEEYKEFYRDVFHDYKEPLFWIHLNMDYPFNLKGILYFPKQLNRMEVMPGQVKLYSNQVFVADNIKEIIPEFLLLLKGVIDCPDMPLNVSRSFLQNDGEVQKIAQHITKKVSDKLHQIFKNDRETYEKYWNDISAFIKFGCLKDEKFYDRMKDILLLHTIDGEYKTLEEYPKADENKIYYVTDENLQAQYISMFRQNGLTAAVLTHVIDPHFISMLEYKEQEKLKFLRIDSDLGSALKTEQTEEEKQQQEEQDKQLIERFKQALPEEKLEYQVESLKSDETPAVILLSEYARRIQDMSRAFGESFGGPAQVTLVLNRENPIIRSLETLPDDKRELVCKQVYDLAQLAHKPLSAEQMQGFMHRSMQLLGMVTGESHQ